MTGRRATLVPLVRPISHNIVEVAGDGITRESTRTYHVVLKLAGEALSSHEVSAGGRAASKDARHVKSALELWSQSMCDVRIDPVVGAVAVTWVAAPAVETQAGKEIRIPFTFPRARSNDTIGKDAAKGNARAIVDEGVGGLRWSPLKVVGLGVVQLEEQEQSVMARKLSPEKYRRLLKNLRNVREGGDEIPKVVTPRSHRDATEG